MSLCYSAHFLMDELTADQKTYIYNMVKAECNYELGRSIPTGYAGDTKAEENGWEADILACALGLYPNDALASQWFDRLRETDLPGVRMDILSMGMSDDCIVAAEEGATMVRLGRALFGARPAKT